MLSVTFYPGGIKIEGHALFSPKGEDIVCAAISGIVFGGINWFEQKNIKVVSDQENDFFLCELQNSDLQNLVAMQVIQTQIQAIAKLYPKHVIILGSSQKINL
ncbi:ribosomal-processing cysteine protease Prp [Mycoplasmoides alvi]|uniref:ribosomal-processing cysteine protease Prp n=1 Tax=Mycoplasmoides alvi TaxID=78580 RepID=UPI00051AB62B|nr:ribosomal-processing cysteine protease Prp [Mycoplasmoides alvi]